MGKAAGADLRLDTPSGSVDGTSPLSGHLGGDLVVSTRFHHYEVDNGLRTAVYLSLFTDRLADEDDDLPTDPDAPFPDRRGYWADFLSPIPGDRWGSRLWLLKGRVLTDDVVAEARTYCLEALEWLGILQIATAEVDTRRNGSRLEIEVVVIDSLTGAERRFSFTWDAMLREGV
ncbi:MAG: phage GP46 family protein [Vicinamibacteria bacterium]